MKTRESLQQTRDQAAEILDLSPAELYGRRVRDVFMRLDREPDVTVYWGNWTTDELLQCFPWGD